MRSARFLTAAVLVMTLWAPTPASAVEDVPSFFAPSIMRDGDDRVFSIGDNTGFSYSSFGRWPDLRCESTNDPKCDLKNSVWGDPKKTIEAKAMLPICAAASDEDCIESLQISDAGGKYRGLTFERYMPDGYLGSDGNTFPSDTARRLPTGSSASIWSEIIDGKASDLKYLALFSYQMNYDNVNDYFVINEVNVAIKPFKEILGNKWDGLWTGNGKTGIQYDFLPQTSFKMTVHASNKLAGWFKSRIQNVSIDISPLSSTNNRLVISGNPVIVPSFAFPKGKSELTSKEENFLNFFGTAKGVVFANSEDPQIFDYLEYWRGKLNDTAAYSNSFWSISSTRWRSQNKCLQDTSRVLGIVSTNAMGFDGNAPTFSDGFLNYRVSGFHYAADGEKLNSGNYDLVIRSDAARCLYGFSNAPISATVSITGSDGSLNLATTQLSEREGWIKLQASGFTFSEKKIMVKLSQKSTSKTKTTVTCIQGKKSKKITGFEPKCPKGYRKK